MYLIFQHFLLIFTQIYVKYYQILELESKDILLILFCFHSAELCTLGCLIFLGLAIGMLIWIRLLGGLRRSCRTLMVFVMRMVSCTLLGCFSLKLSDEGFEPAIWIRLSLAIFDTTHSMLLGLSQINLALFETGHSWPQEPVVLPYEDRSYAHIF